MFAVTKKSASPLYEQIKEGLRAEVESGRFKPGESIPDENVLAAQLSVSHMTVRRAVVELSREGLFKRVSGRGTFVRSHLTPQIKTRRGAVAIVSNQDPLLPASQFYYRMQQSLLYGLEPLGMPLLFRCIREPFEDFASALRKDTSIRGVVAIWLDQPRYIAMLTKLPIPTVLLDCVQPEPAILDEVAQDGEPGVFGAVNHLIKLGHRDIAMMTSERLNAIAQQRVAGYQRALTANGLSVDPEQMHRVVYWEGAGFTQMRQILNGPRVPTAVVCSGDGQALGAMAAVREHGWRIPRDMSITGFGDEGHFTVPQLSTVRVPIEQMGESAARLLSERMKRPTAPPQRVVFRSEWICRGSCDYPRVTNVE